MFTHRGLSVQKYFVVELKNKCSCATKLEPEYVLKSMSMWSRYQCEMLWFIKDKLREGFKKKTRKSGLLAQIRLNFFFYCFRPITGGIWYHPPEIIEGVQLNVKSNIRSIVNLIVGLKFGAHSRLIHIQETFGTHSEDIGETFRKKLEHIWKTFDLTVALTFEITFD